jgi:hypothetical protein
MNGYFNFWSLLMMSLYWVKTQIPKKNKEFLVDSNQEDDVEVNTEKNKCMFITPPQNALQKQSTKARHQVTTEIL